MRIKVGDTVEVIAGNDSGQRGKVLRLDRDAGKLVVEGMNRVFKHMRRSQKNPQGGRLSKEMPIQISNVMLVCPSCNAATKTAVKFAEDGAKHRVCKKCNAQIGPISPPRARPAAAGRG